MAAISIIDIYDKIQRSNGDYCKVCFHTSRERRLVAPVSFTHFLRAVIGYKSSKSGIKVCYICEGLALSAMKFYNAVAIGLELEDLCQRIKVVGLRNVVLKHLNGTSPINRPSHTKLCQRATRSQSNMSRVQGFMPHSLQHTDTLVVTIDRPVQQITTMMPVAIGTSQEPNNRQDNTIVLEEMNEATRSTTVFKVTPLIQHHQMVVHLLDEETNHVTEHPIVRGLDGNKYVPSLKLQILPGNVFKSVPDKILLSNTNTQTNGSPQKTQEKLSVEKSIGSNYDTFVSMQNSDVKPAQVNSMQDLICTENMNIILNFDELPESNSKKKKRSDSNVNSDVPNKSSALKVSSECRLINSDAIEKQPISSTDRVDWEDKIPMDVISFMNATDPNPVDRIMQSPAYIPPTLVLAAPPPAGIGFISDVRTIDDDDDVQILGHVECIDLC